MLGDDGQQFPIAAMAGVDDSRRGGVAQLHEAIEIDQFDPAVSIAILRCPVPDAVELGIFREGAAEIVPGGDQDRLDFGRGFFGKCRAQVAAPDIADLEMGPDLAADESGEARGPVDRHQPQETKENRDARRLKAVGKSLAEPGQTSPIGDEAWRRATKAGAVWPAGRPLSSALIRGSQY